MPQGIVYLFELVEINEVNGAHVVGPPFAEGSLHSVTQNGAIGQAGQSIKSRQMILLGFGNLSLGDVLRKNDHSSISMACTVNSNIRPFCISTYKSDVVAARQPGVQTIDQVLRIDLGNQACFDTAFNHIDASFKPFSSKSGGNPI